MKLLTTDDTALAAYLYLMGVDFLKGTVKTEIKNRRAFVFKKQDGIYKMIEDFYQRETKVAPLDFQEARSQITKWLKTDINIKIKENEDGR